MNKQYLEDSFLARWISGDLSPEEQQAFEKSDDYVVFNKINETSLKLDAPVFDASSLFNKIQTEKSVKNQKTEPKIVKLFPNWAYGVAASIVIALGVFYAMNLQSNFETQFSEQLAISLPDQSKVELNSNSDLHFKKFNWDSNRVVELNGEAFFDVEKGEKFRVITKEGIIEVLGTEFNIVSRGDYFEVQCHEGKVKVVNIDTSIETILTKGKAVRFVDNTREEWTFTQLKPDWISGESTFKNAPLSQVIIALENQFKIVFDKSKIDTNKRFTGGFSHTDLKLALKTVFKPMYISYHSDDSNTIILNSSPKIQADN